MILSGMGGDEVFAGYPRHLAAQHRAAGGRPAGRARAAASAARVEANVTLGRPGRLRGPRRNLRKLAGGLDRDPVERYLTYCSYYRPRGARRACWRRTCARARRPRPVPAAPRLLRPRRGRALAQPDPLRRPEDLPAVPQPDLHGQDEHGRVDRGARAAARRRRGRARGPDPAASSSCAGSRASTSSRRAWRGRCRTNVIHRPKAGFGAPVRSWLVGDLKPMIDDMLSPRSGLALAASSTRPRCSADPGQRRRAAPTTRCGSGRS